VTDVVLRLLVATPAPSPTRTGLDPNSVSPGVVGFLATFVLVLASILLFVNMARRLRRLRFREEQAERARREDDSPPPPSQ
jgi:hypothetical protein